MAFLHSHVLAKSRMASVSHILEILSESPHFSKVSSRGLDLQFQKVFEIGEDGVQLE